MASRSDALAGNNITSTVRILRARPKEGKFLEWKEISPLGAPRSVKCGFVKDMAAFANTKGGFLVIGVDNTGIWKGISSEAAEQLDPGKLEQLLSNYIEPPISFQVATVSSRGKVFGMIHVEPSELAPHVCMKEERDTAPNGNDILLRRRAVYVRSIGNCDIASQRDFERIFNKRHEAILDHILKRTREVIVERPVFQGGVGPPKGSVAVRSTTDLNATAVRLTRDPSKATGAFLHEQVSPALVESADNLVDLNHHLFRESRPVFSLRSESYYYIYAERETLTCNADKALELLRGSLQSTRSMPFLYWVLHCEKNKAIQVISDYLCSSTTLTDFFSIRVAGAFGRNVLERYSDRLSSRFEELTQKPETVYSAKRILENPCDDPCLLSCRLGTGNKVTVPNADRAYEVRELITDSKKARELLTLSCQLVVDGKDDCRALAKDLDFISYARECLEIGKSVANRL